MVPVHSRLDPLALWVPAPNRCHDGFRFLSLTLIVLKRQTKTVFETSLAIYKDLSSV